MPGSWHIDLYKCSTNSFFLLNNWVHCLVSNHSTPMWSKSIMPGFYIATQKHGCYIKFNGKQMHAILDPSSQTLPPLIITIFWRLIWWVCCSCYSCWFHCVSLIICNGVNHLNWDFISHRRLSILQYIFFSIAISKLSLHNI